MNATSQHEHDQLRRFGGRHARCGYAKPDPAAWSRTYGQGRASLNAYDSFCRGYDEASAHPAFALAAPTGGRTRGRVASFTDLLPHALPV